MRKTGLKIVSLLLTTVFAFAVFPSLKSNADGVSYSFDSTTKTLTISGNGEVTQVGVLHSFGSGTNLKDLKTVVITGEGITGIDSQAFNGASNLTSVTIPASVTSIGVYAFYGCSSLTSVMIPSGVTEIGENAFFACANLEEVYMDTKLVKQCSDNGVFMSCPADIEFHYYYNATYSCEHGTIEGNKETFGTDKLTITPEDYYELVELSYTFAGSNEKTIIIPVASGDYRMPDIDISVTNRNIVVTASFKLIQKTVTFCDEDGTTILQSGKVDATTIPTYGGDTPTKPADDQYTYTFAGWTDGTNEYKPTDTLPIVTDDVTYTAMYTGTTNVYTVTFTDDSGQELQSSDVKYGEAPEYTGDTPTKAETDKYTYTFAGWIDGTGTYGTIATLPAVTGNVTYTAVYESTTKKYTVKFVDDNGNVLQSSEVEYGKSPSFNGTLPTKADTDQYTYKFAEWSDGELAYFPEETLPAVTGPVTYTAVFDATEIEQQKAVDPVVEPDIRPVTDTVVQKPGVYYLNSLTGDGVNTDVVATIKRTEDDVHCVEYFGNAEVDGTPMTVGEQIDVGSGSTIITIKKEFLATLGEGTHTLKVLFTDGGSITIEFTVKAAANNGASVPATGEKIGMTTVLGACLILGAAGVVVAFAMKKRKDET